MKKQLIVHHCRSYVGRLLRITLTMMWLGIVLDSAGQVDKPRWKPKSFEIKIDENGMLRELPPYALVTDKTYEIKVIIDSMPGQQEKLLKFLAEKSLESYNQIQDDIARANDLFGAAATQDLLEDLKAVNTIASMERNDALNALQDSNCRSLTSFISKDVLKDLLFDRQMTLSVNGKTYSFDYKKGFDTTLIITADQSENRINVVVEDKVKMFLKAYFDSTLSKENLDAQLKNVNIQRFYTQDVPAAKLTYDAIKSLLDTLTKADTPVLCNTGLMQRYHDLKNRTSLFYNLVRSKWMLYWSWYTGSNFRLNPLPFTDEARLPASYAMLEADKDTYRRYLDSVISLMLRADQLNTAKTDYKHMDSLLQERQSNRFATARIQALKAVNKEQATAMQQTMWTANSIITINVEKKKRRKLILRAYNASDKLKGGSMPEAVPTDTRVVAVAYNIPQKKEVTFKENASPIEDKSAAVKDVNSALDIAGTGIGGAAKTSSAFSQIVSGFRAKDYKPGLTITPVENQESINKLYERESNNPYQMRLTKDPQGNSVLLMLVHNGQELEHANLTETALDFLAEKNLQCGSFPDKVLQKIRGFQEVTVNLGTIEAVASNGFKEKVKAYADSVNHIIAEVYKQEMDLIINDLTDLAKKWGVVAAFGEYPRYILPPAKFESNTDTTPAYRNKIFLLANETSAQKKSFELALIDSKTQATQFTYKGSYKTSPEHLFTASIGVLNLVSPVYQVNATMENGAIRTSVDEERVRLFAGLHLHPWKILLTNDKPIWQLCGRDFFSRVSLFAGVSFPKPLYNPHAGLSFDIWAGIKANVGYHWYRYTEYTVVNNQITDEKSRYRKQGLWYGISIDPVTFAKIIGLLNL